MDIATVKVGDILTHRDGGTFTVESIGFSRHAKCLGAMGLFVSTKGACYYNFVIWQDWEILDNAWRIKEPLNPLEVY